MAASDLSLHLAKDVGPRGRTGPLFYQTYSNKGQSDSSGLWHNSMRLQAAIKIVFKSTALFISDREIGLDFVSCSCRACELAGRSCVDTDGLNAGVTDGSISTCIYSCMIFMDIYVSINIYIYIVSTGTRPWRKVWNSNALFPMKLHEFQ